MAGMDPMRYLHSEDPIEIAVMYGIYEKWLERKQELDEQLARRIINALGEAMKK